MIPFPLRGRNDPFQQERTNPMDLDDFGTSVEVNIYRLIPMLFLRLVG